jgi:hypothetical protein
MSNAAREKVHVERRAAPEAFKSTRYSCMKRASRGSRMVGLLSCRVYTMARVRTKGEGCQEPGRDVMRSKSVVGERARFMLMFKLNDHQLKAGGFKSFRRTSTAD